MVVGSRRVVRRVAPLLLAALLPAIARAQPAPTDCRRLDGARHWDRLATLLTREEADGPRVTGPAVLIPVRNLHLVGAAAFERPTAVALLRLSAAQGALPAGDYCMRVQRDAGAPAADTRRWTVRYHRVTGGVMADAPAHETRGLVYYLPDDDDGGRERPRPAARLAYVDPDWTPAALDGDAPGGGAGGAGTGGHDGHGGAAPPLGTPTAATGAAPPRRAAIGYTAWYRCGNGCCGASLRF